MEISEWLVEKDVVRRKGRGDVVEGITLEE